MLHAAWCDAHYYCTCYVEDLLQSYIDALLYDTVRRSARSESSPAEVLTMIMPSANTTQSWLPSGAQHASRAATAGLHRCSPWSASEGAFQNLAVLGTLQVCTLHCRASLCVFSLHMQTISPMPVRAARQPVQLHSSQCTQGASSSPGTCTGRVLTGGASAAWPSRRCRAPRPEPGRPRRPTSACRSRRARPGTSPRPRARSASRAARLRHKGGMLLGARGYQALCQQARSGSTRPCLRAPG
jgi:hypothetical protein